MGQRRYRRYKSKYNYNPGRSVTLPKFLAILALIVVLGIAIAIIAARDRRQRRITAEVADTLAVEQQTGIIQPEADTTECIPAEDTAVVKKPVRQKKEKKEQPSPTREPRRKKKHKSEHSNCTSPAPLMNMVLTNEMSDIPDLNRMDREMERFMRYWNFTGCTLAITDNDRLVYCKGYGMKDDYLPMTPGTLMRIASVSKLITATAVMRLVEEGTLSPDTRVFGDDGILNDTSYTNVIRDKRYYEITVDQLLKHESGISNRYGDPMFCTRDIIMQNHLDKAPDHMTLLRCVLRRPLSFEPGTTYRYSNFGYLLLSMVIEQVTGEDYEQWVQKNLLEPAGCRDMHLAGNYYHERRLNESRYYMQPNAGLTAPFNGTRDSVLSCYGGSDIRALSGAGGWIASAPELARFICAIDGLEGIPDIISEKSRHAMTTPNDLSKKPFGWANRDTDGTLTRSGTLDGSTIMVRYYPDGQCWIFISNTDAWRGPYQSSSNAAHLDRLREKYSGTLPDIDLFERINQ